MLILMLQHTLIKIAIIIQYLILWVIFLKVLILMDETIIHGVSIVKDMVIYLLNVLLQSAISHKYNVLFVV